MGELLLQERKVRGNFHGGSELPTEGAGLQGAEECVEFGKVGAVADLLSLDGFDDGGEAVLKVERRERNRRGPKCADIQVLLNLSTLRWKRCEKARLIGASSLLRCFLRSR